MASPTRWTWVWVNSGSWWWTGRPDVLQFMGSPRVGHDWATGLNWTELIKTNLATFHCQSHPLGWHTVYGVCFSLYLNKSTFYLSLCLSLNSFCDETSRTWASLGPETRYCGFWLGSSPSHVCSSPRQSFGCVQVLATWAQVPSRVLAGFESQPCGFKSQTGFWLGSSPSHVGAGPNLR